MKANDTPTGLGRRHFLQAMSCMAAGMLPGMALAHGNVGPVRPPLVMPDIPMLRHDGTRLSLHALLKGKATALQLMFTGCSDTCTLQGALFSEVQPALKGQAASSMQLLSVSIDPLNDNPAALRAWLKKFDAGRHWIAAAPDIRQVDALRTLLEQASGPADNHGGQVFLFDKEARLVWRMENLPPPQAVARQLSRIATA